MLKRCNYCMILIIFIVNTSEFAYFFFKSGDSHQGRQWLLVLLSPGGVRIEQFVTNCGGERLQCNHLPSCQLCNLHVSNSVMFVYILIYVLLLLYALDSTDWHLLDVVHNVLNMQRYVTSAAGQTCRFSGKAGREAANISASMKTFHCYDIVRQFYPSDIGITGVTDKSRWENLL